MVVLPKSRPQRVERSTPVNFYASGDESMTWAVSYADLLMVLLSFFVLFFSLGKDEAKSVLYGILRSGDQQNSAMHIDRPAAGAASETNKAGGFSGAGGSQTSSQKSKPMRSHIMLDIQGVNLSSRIKKIEDGESLILLLPDNSYAQGGQVLKGESEKLFDETIRRLTKYQKDIQITLIGSADTGRVSSSRSKIIQDNFDLSAIRATRALQRAAHLGFPMDQLQAKAEGQFGRSSRTLSIQVTVREKP